MAHAAPTETIEDAIAAKPEPAPTAGRQFFRLVAREQPVLDKVTEYGFRSASERHLSLQALQLLGGDEPTAMDQLHDILRGFRSGHGDYHRVGEIPQT